MRNGKVSWEKLWKDQSIRRWVILLIVGILILVWIPVGEDTAGQESGSKSGNNGTGSKSVQEDGTGAEEGTAVYEISRYEQELERRLTQLLGQIQGAGQVRVMVTVKRSSELILQKDTSREEEQVRETDPQGGVRNNSQLREESQTVLVGGSGNSQPYIIGEIMPQVEGVVVACEGGDRASIQAEISAAVQALFDLEPHKIKVCKMASP